MRRVAALSQADLEGKGADSATAATNDPLILTASRFAELTGVDRERLRTWERRFGFPQPLRSGPAGRRTYDASDVPRVVAVRQAVDSGTPVKSAIEGALQAAGEFGSLPATVLGHSALACPLPLVVVAGPQPLVVELVNDAARRSAPHLTPGTPLEDCAPWLDDETLDALRRRFSADAPVRGARPGWLFPEEPPCPATFVSLPTADVSQPRIAIWDNADEREQRAAAAQDMAARSALLAQSRAAYAEKMLAAASGVASELQHLSSDQAASRGPELLVEHFEADDAALAVLVGAHVSVRPSARRQIPASLLPLAAYSDMAQLLRSASIDWLSETTRTALGAPAESALLCIPLKCAAQEVGAVILLFAEVFELETVVCEALNSVAAVMAFAVMHQHLVNDVRAAHLAP